MTLPLKKGFDNHQMVEAAKRGQLHSLYIIGEDMVIRNWTANFNAESFSQIPFLVVQDCFFSQTCQFAMLCYRQALCWKRGEFVSTERRSRGCTRYLSPGRKQTRLADHSRHREQAGCKLELPNLPILCRRSQVVRLCSPVFLRTAARLWLAAMAGFSRRTGPTSTLYKGISCLMMEKPSCILCSGWVRRRA